MKRKPAPGLLTVFTLVQANPFVLWASVSSLRPNPCPTYLERCYANKRHCNELLGTWTPFSRKEASASLIKQLRHVECTMIYPNGQMLPDEMSFTSSRQRFTAGEPASRFPVFPERAGTFARRFLGAGRVPSASSYSECWVQLACKIELEGTLKLEGSVLDERPWPQFHRVCTPFAMGRDHAPEGWSRSPAP